MDREAIKKHIRAVLEEIGEDPQREGLQETPGRVARMYEETMRGYDESRKPELTVFENTNGYDEIILDEHYFYSQCEHHLVPFFGAAFVAYIPDEKIIGISKLARIVDHYAAKLQVQERLTEEVAQFLEETLQPKGVGVVLHARHLCREMRGVKKHGALMTTSSMRGCFREDAQTRAELMSLIQERLI